MMFPGLIHMAGSALLHLTPRDAILNAEGRWTALGQKCGRRDFPFFGRSRKTRPAKGECHPVNRAVLASNQRETAF